MTFRYAKATLPDLAGRPILAAAKVIADRRGHQRGSTRWMEVCAVAQHQLIDAHVAGQRDALRDVLAILNQHRPNNLRAGSPEFFRRQGIEIAVAAIEARILHPETPEEPLEIHPRRRKVLRSSPRPAESTAAEKAA